MYLYCLTSIVSYVGYILYYTYKEVKEEIAEEKSGNIRQKAEPTLSVAQVLPVAIFNLSISILAKFILAFCIFYILFQDCSIRCGS